jgi:hypothetical protein
MPLFGDQVISFLKELHFGGELPEGISVMNPFTGNPDIPDIISEFYRKYYSDNKLRHMIIGINPGRFGAGTTGIPFTDTVRLKEKLGLDLPGRKTHEPSSVFMYEMIDRYGGAGKFYNDFFITSVSPLGFTRTGPKGGPVNYNYYDSPELTRAILGFSVESLYRQLEFGISKDLCFCLGTGKNFRFLQKLNDEHGFFSRIEPLEHPRFIMQYRAKQKERYLDLYVEKLRSANGA